jgi:hypothetical protein
MDKKSKDKKLKKEKTLTLKEGTATSKLKIHKNKSLMCKLIIPINMREFSSSFRRLKILSIYRWNLENQSVANFSLISLLKENSRR